MCSCTFYYEINHLDLLKKLKLVIYIRLFSVIVCVLSKLPMRSLFLCFHQFVMKYIFINYIVLLYPNTSPTVYFCRLAPVPVSNYANSA